MTNYNRDIYLTSEILSIVTNTVTDTAALIKDEVYDMLEKVNHSEDMTHKDVMAMSLDNIFSEAMVLKDIGGSIQEDIIEAYIASLYRLEKLLNMFVGVCSAYKHVDGPADREQYHSCLLSALDLIDLVDSLYSMVDQCTDERDKGKGCMMSGGK